LYNFATCIAPVSDLLRLRLLSALAVSSLNKLVVECNFAYIELLLTTYDVALNVVLASLAFVAFVIIMSA
jgi:hypothetical protein